MAHYDIKGDGELDKMLNICDTNDCFCAPVDSFLSPSARHTHIVSLTANEIKGKIGDLRKIVVGDTIGIGQFNGDQLPTWARLTDVDVLVDGEPGLVLKMKWTNGFTPAAPVYVDRESETKSTGPGVAAVCNHAVDGDLEAISGGTNTESGQHLIATFDGTDVANRVLTPTRPVFEVVALPAPLPNDPPGTANHLRGGLVLKLRMNFVDRSQCSQMRVCDCCVPRAAE
jgi:hypothetical protein